MKTRINAMKTRISVGEIMTRNFFYCSPDTNIISAAKMMSKNKIGSLLVKTNKKLEGIITERDILWALAKKENLKGVKVKDIMSKRVKTIAPSKDVLEALFKMRKEKLRRLPVVENNKLVGFITIRDIIKIFPSLFDVWAESLRIKEEKEKLKRAGHEEEYYERYLK